MIVIVEGIDRVGKTTLCNMLHSKFGFINFKDDWNIVSLIHPLANFICIGKLDTAISLLRMLDKQGFNVVIDRFHLTELVYGAIERRQFSTDEILQIDNELALMNTMLVYVKSTDIEDTNTRANKDLSKHDLMFDELVQSSCIHKKYTTDFDDFTSALHYIVTETFHYDIYLASPFFNPEQVSREEAVKQQLRRQGLTVFSPKENCFLPPYANTKEQTYVFQQNCDAIEKSMAVLAVTDGKDMGTVWEAGYACGKNKPVLYFNETLSGAAFNLMLARSGRGVFIGLETLTYENIHKALFEDSGQSYEGMIE